MKKLANLSFLGFPDQEILELTPPGTIPVAVFPPFAILPRRFPAEAVIFQETNARGPRKTVDRNVKEKLLRHLNCFKPRVNRKFGIRPQNTNQDADFDESPIQNLRGVG